MPGTAAFDAARLMMVFNEYTERHDDFMIKAAILLNKIQKRKDEDKERLAAEAAANPPPEKTKDEPKAKPAPKAKKKSNAEEE
jgi:hypothetical protein